jgi:hypothetical protein
MSLSIAAAVASALRAAGVVSGGVGSGGVGSGGGEGLVTPRPKERECQETPPSIVALKKRIRGLKAASATSGRPSEQVRSDAILLAETEYELERLEAKERKRGRYSI